MLVAGLKIDYALTEGGLNTALTGLARVERQRHRIESLFQVANGNAGVDGLEVGKWAGCQPNMNLKCKDQS